ncbi:hypothetical protein [Streptomyces sp. NPDC058279]|uniref:hypothetical protein n=1 Tax=Streptomyces sp. NPDC058279 TaxID=3346418 RepID=UPI0036E7FD3A
MSQTWQYDVRADRGWQATDIRKVADSSKGVSVRADGEWKHSPDWDAVGPDGNIPGKEGAFYPHLVAKGRTEYPHSGDDAYVGSLIGKWGPDGGVFRINKGLVFDCGPNVDTSKTLYLAINDRPDELSENTGVMHVFARIYNSGDREQNWYYDRIANCWRSSTN